MSAQQAQIGFAVGGLIIGAYFGSPAIGFALGSLAGSLLFPGPDPPPTLGPRLGDSQTQVSAYGMPVPIIYGTDRMAGNVIWAEPIEERAESENASGGGKGGSPKQETVTFSYFGTLTIALCNIEIEGIRRIWIDDALYADLSAPNPGSQITLTVYRGTTEQEPDPTMEAQEGVGNVPAHRGLAYVVIRALPLQEWGNRIPTFHFEVVENGTHLVVASVYTDGGTFGTGQLEVDDDTGFVWVTSGLSNTVKVMDCSTGALTLVTTIDHVAARGISFQPSYVSQDSILAVPLISTVPARMWVATSAPALGNFLQLIGYLTDGSYKADIINNFTGAAFCWPGEIIVDKSTIKTLGPTAAGTAIAYNATTNGICVYVAAFSMETVNTTPEFLVGYNTVGGDVSDMSLGSVGVIYILDIASTLIRIDGFYVTGSVSAANGFADNSQSVTYDKEENTIYTRTRDFGGSFWIRKWDSSLTQIWEREFSGAINPTNVRWHEGFGDVWYSHNTSSLLHFVRINKQTGEDVEDLIVSNFTGSTGFFILYPFASFAVATTANDIIKVPLVPAGNPVDIPLSEIVTDLTLRTGTLIADDIDVTDITSLTVKGYILSQRMPVRNALEPLLKHYFVDAVESDGKIKFTRRGSAPVLTIPKEDLATEFEQGSGDVSPLSEKRTQENELPRSLDGRYKDVDDHYKIGVVNVRRLTGNTQQARTQDMPIVFESSAAKKIVDTLMYSLYLDRDPKDIFVSRKYLKLDPGDVITVEHPKVGNIDIRINTAEFQWPQLIKIQGMVEDTTIYSGFTFPGPVTLAPPVVVPAKATVLLLLLDIHILDDADNDTGLYIGVYTLSGTFQAAGIFRSPDANAYTQVQTVVNETSVATLDTALIWSGSFK